MNSSKQRGLSTLGWLGVIAVGGFALTALFKLGPIYLENWTIHKLMVQIQDDPAAGKMSVAEIRDKLQKKLTINGVQQISIRDIKFKREQGRGTLIDASYEVRVPFMFNIDAVVKFPHNTLLIPNNASDDTP